MTLCAGSAMKFTWPSTCMRMAGLKVEDGGCLTFTWPHAQTADRWSYDPLNSAAEFTYATQCQIAAILYLAMPSWVAPQSLICSSLCSISVLQTCDVCRILPRSARIP